MDQGSVWNTIYIQRALDELGDELARLTLSRAGSSAATSPRASCAIAAMTTTCTAPRVGLVCGGSGYGAVAK